MNPLRKSLIVNMAAIAVTASITATPAFGSEIVRSGAWTQQETSTFKVAVSFDETHGACVTIVKKETSEMRYVCDYDADVFVDDLLNSASGRMTRGWSYTTTTSSTKGKKTTTTEKTVTGTTSADLTWLQNGETTVTPKASADYTIVVPWCHNLFSVGPYCDFPTVNPNASVMRQRPALASGTVTDSEWGTFTFSAVPGGLSDYHHDHI